MNAGVVTELTISTDSPLPGAVQSIAYSASLAASGGAAPYSWNVSAGALPDGLTLSAAGVIGGAPTASGGFTFAAQVTDGVNATKTKVFTLTVAASALTITTVSPLPDGIYAAAYSQTLSATGGTAPVHVDGQRRSRAGRFVAQHRGRAQRHRDRAGRVQFCRARRRQRRTDRDASIRNHGSRAAAHHHEHFAAAIRRALTVAYSQALIAVGGVGSYAWSISVGALPAGLSLSGAEDLSGTPAASGTFNFTLRATDGAGTQAVKAFTFIVTPAPLVISSGATLADGIVGSVYSQTLAATGGVLPYAWSVGGGTLPGGLTKLNVEPPQAPRASRHALCKSPPLRGAELSTFNFQSLAAAPACTTF